MPKSSYAQLITQIANLDIKIEPNAFEKLTGKYKYFRPDDLNSKVLFEEIYKLCQHMLKEKEHYSGPKSHEYAYKIMVYFGRENIQTTIEALDHFIDRHLALSNQPIIDCFNKFTLPKCPEFAQPNYNLPEWKTHIQDFGWDVIRYTKLLGKIEERNNDLVPLDSKIFKESLLKTIYLKNFYPS